LRRAGDPVASGRARPVGVVAMLSTAEFTRRVVIVLALCVGLMLTWRIAHFLLLGFGGVVFAIVIRAAAHWLSARLPIATRWASALVALALLATAGLLAWGIGDEVVSQLNALQVSMPDVSRRVRDRIEASAGGRELLAMLGAFGSEQLWSSFAVRTAGLVLSVRMGRVIVLQVAIYLSFSPRSYVDGFLALLPARHRAEGGATLAEISRSLRGWLVGQLGAMTFVGVLTAGGLWLAGVPQAVGLGIAAALLNFVPMIGPFVAAVPGVLIAFATDPSTALYAALVYLVVQQLESSFIVPLAQRWAVRLPPAVGLLSVIAFGAVFGVPGFLFGAPLTVVILVLLRRFHTGRERVATTSSVQVPADARHPPSPGGPA
jgi:predicted PurR-regulated permease PerM